MNSKVKGVLQVLLVLVLIAAFAFVAARGIGGAHRGSAKNIRLGLDLEGGVSVTYQAYKTDSTGKRTGEQPTDKDMADTIYKMQKRVETLESTEAAVYQEGSDRVTIDIPGASDSEEVLKELGKAGALYFILYSDLKTEKGGTPNEGDKVVYDKSKVLPAADSRKAPERLNMVFLLNSQAKELRNLLRLPESMLVSSLLSYTMRS